MSNPNIEDCCQAVLDFLNDNETDPSGPANINMYKVIMDLMVLSIFQL